jgi:hypothetical protein
MYMNLTQDEPSYQRERTVILIFGSQVISVAKQCGISPAQVRVPTHDRSVF